METKNKNGHHKIAIVGTGSLFPGAFNTKEFWLNILNERDFIKDVPETHWLKEDYYDPNNKTGDKVYCKKGAFLDDVSFDPVEYGMPPNLLSATDTVQLLSLIVAKNTLADTKSYQSGKVDSTKTSVILGVAGGTELIGQMSARIHTPEWVMSMRNQGLPESKIQAILKEIDGSYATWTENTFPGLLGNVVSGRIANRFNLKGTNCVLDAACASSLAAVKMAVQELQLGTTDMVITGGSDALNDIFMYMCFSKTTALSPTEDCRPFSDSGDGTVLGEAVAMMSLKRLEDAEKDGDQIYAVISSVGSSADGKSGSIYAPDSIGQSIAIKRAYEGAGYSPKDVELIEAHGTGTMAGDYAEFKGLKLAFGATEYNQYCALGSVKSMIGHTKSAAGAASLLKIAMALSNKTLPPTLKIKQANKNLKIEESPFYLNTYARPWVHDELSPRKAGVSSMGFGGTNFHVAIEEYDNASFRPKKVYRQKKELLLFSANNAEQIITELTEMIDMGLDQDLVQLAKYHQNKFDSTEGCRLAILGESIEEIQKWSQYARNEIEKKSIKIEIKNSIYFSIEKSNNKVAYLFSGQGSQYVNMGSDLIMQYDEALSAWDKVSVMNLDPNKRLNDVVYPIPVFNENDRADQSNLLVDTKWAQPAIGTMAISHLNLLKKLNLTPTIVGGHSYGEVAALYAAGVIKSEEDFINISRVRGELMAKAGVNSKGAMSAVFTSEKDVKEILNRIKSKVVIANINSPSQTVISGNANDIVVAEKELEKLDIRFQRLNVSTAFHSELVADSAVGFKEYLEKIEFDKSKIPVYSNTTGERYVTKGLNYAKSLAQQLAEPVQFEKQINAMYAEGVRTFLEVGPNKILGNFIKDILKDKPHNAISIDGGKKVNSKDAFWNALGQLAVAGVDVSFSELWENIDDNKKVVSDRKPSIATVKINGSNYGKPYPPKGGYNSLPKPNAELVEIVPEKESPTQKTQFIQKNENSNMIIENNETVASDMKTNIESKVNINRIDKTPSKMSGINSEWFSAFESVQKNTLDAQKRFQDTLTESHKLFLETSQTAINNLGVLSGQNNLVQQQAPNIAPVNSVPKPQNVVSVQDQKRPVSNFVASAVIDKEQVPVRQSEPDKSLDFKNVMLQVVAEKTGYPKEILDMDTDLESGLGIDSIKRVEILSALQEAFPELKSVDKAKLAAMNTLGEILDYSNSETSKGVSDEIVKSSNNLSGLSDVMLQIVSEKTGYPKEILDLSTDLESGLGIDSIKRVEILSALQEAFPELKSVDKAKLAALNTLGEILDYSNSETSNELPDEVVKSSNNLSGFKDVMLQIVSEKTGYPKEILDLSTDLESGLGIDSIKRVEILSALQEAFPELKSVDKAKLAAMNTLGEILNYSNSETSNGEPQELDESSDDLSGFKDAMLQIVSDKTGYPKEILDMDTDLESGLGIDSIKRVEILSALQVKFPVLKSVDKSKLAAMNTLGEIMHFSQNSPETSAADVLENLEKKSVNPGNIYRYTVSRAPILDNGFGLTSWKKAEPLFLLEDDQGIAKQLEKLFKAVKVKTNVVSSLPEDATHVINLKGLNSFKESSIEQILDSNKISFDIANQCGKRLFEGQGCLILPFDNGLANKTYNRAWSGGISALAKTAKLEWPAAEVLSVNIDTSKKAPKKIASELFQAITSGGKVTEIEIDVEGNNYQLISTVADMQNRSRSFNDGDSIIASGGAKGVTAACLIALSERKKLNIGILGRTQLEDEPEYLRGLVTDGELKGAVFQRATNDGLKVTPIEVNTTVSKIVSNREIHETLETLRKNGSNVNYLSVDISSKTKVHKAIGQLRNEFGAINGIIHAAGVLADKYIHEKTQDQFNKVFKTKVEGFINMLEATAKDKLSHICCFSSVSARMGNIGQVDYAMANEVLNKVCQAEQLKRKESCLVKSMNWGPWDGGMVSPQLKNHFESLGVDLIPLKTGAKFFADEMEDDSIENVEIVVGGSFDMWGEKDNASKECVHKMWIHKSNNASLESHRIETNVVVPIMMANEWSMRLAKSIYPNFNISEVKNVQVFKGIRLDNFDSTGDILEFVFTINQKVDTEIDVKIQNTEGTLFYGITVVMSSHIQDPEKRIASVENLTSWELNSKDIYPKSLFHGPDFQVIDRMEGISENGCTGLLAMDSTQNIRNTDRISDLFLFDGGIQMATLAMEKWTGNKSSLPLGYESLLIYSKPRLAEQMKCELILKKKGDMNSEWDVHFRNHEDEVLAEMKGLRMYMYQAN